MGKDGEGWILVLSWQFGKLAWDLNIAWREPMWDWKFTPREKKEFCIATKNECCRMIKKKGGVEIK